MKAGYSITVADDGTLTLDSAEVRNSGIYQMVAQNRAGRVERELMLTVNSVEEERKGAESPAQDEGGFWDVPLALLGRHVESYHATNNRGYNSEYQVSYVRVKYYIIFCYLTINTNSIVL